MKARKQMVGLDMTRMGKRSRKFCGLVREGVFMRVGAVGGGACGAWFGWFGASVLIYPRSNNATFPKKKTQNKCFFSKMRTHAA